MEEVLKVMGAVAGLAGLSVGLVLIIFRDVIRQRIFPRLSQKDAYKLLSTIVTFSFAIALTGILAWTYSLSIKPPDPVILPGDSGWILLGYYDQTQHHFLAPDPVFTITASSYSTQPGIPNKGDHITLHTVRHVYIMDYKNHGLANQDQPMWQVPEGKLRPDDYTGVALQKDTRLEIRDISSGQFPGEPLAVWARVTLIP